VKIMASKAKAKAKAKAKTTETGGARTIGGKVVNLSQYQKAKTATGGTSLNCGDQVADLLAGKDLDAVYDIASKKTGVSSRDLKAKYGSLNPGMQRMALGNRIRGAANGGAKKEKKTA
jgi:hypothetical protein